MHVICKAVKLCTNLLRQNPLFATLNSTKPHFLFRLLKKLVYCQHVQRIMSIYSFCLCSIVQVSLLWMTCTIPPILQYIFTVKYIFTAQNIHFTKLFKKFELKVISEIWNLLNWINLRKNRLLARVSSSAYLLNFIIFFLQCGLITKTKEVIF